MKIVFFFVNYSIYKYSLNGKINVLVILFRFGFFLDIIVIFDGIWINLALRVELKFLIFSFIVFKY